MSIEFTERVLSIVQTFTKCFTKCYTGGETDDITPRYVSTSPPDKLDCLDSVYSQYSLADLRAHLSNFKTTIWALNIGARADFELNVEHFLIGLSEFYRVIERTSSNITSHQIEVMIRMITVIHQVNQKQFVDQINIPNGLCSALGVRDFDNHDNVSLDNLRRNDGFTFVVAVKGVMSEYVLGTAQIYSLEFAEDFKNLLTELGLNAHEVGAGRGMLTAALKKVGFDVKSTTDIDIDTDIPSWPTVKVTKKNALEVIKENPHNAIFLIGAADDWMLKEIFEDVKQTEKKVLVLLLGYDFNEMLSKEADIIKRIRLNISDYFQMLPSHGIQLLGINYSEDDFAKIALTIPKTMLIEELIDKSKLLYT